MALSCVVPVGQRRQSASSGKLQRAHGTFFGIFEHYTPHTSIVKYYTPTTEDKGGWLVGDKQGVPRRLRPIRRSSGDTERTTGGAECPQLCLSTERAPWKLVSH